MTGAAEKDKERVERALALVREAEDLVRAGLPHRYLGRQEELWDSLEKARRILTWFDAALGSAEREGGGTE